MINPPIDQLLLIFQQGDHQILNEQCQSILSSVKQVKAFIKDRWSRFQEQKKEFQKELMNPTNITMANQEFILGINDRMAQLQTRMQSIVFLIQDNVAVGGEKPSFYRSFRKIDNDRKEKVVSYGGGKCSYMDLLYPKGAQDQPCVFCVLNPQYQRVNKLLGDLCGPLCVPHELQDQLKQSNLNFHELCAYWSTFTQCDELKGQVNIDSLVGAVVKGVLQECYLCKWPGAMTKCNEPQCAVFVHYSCFVHLESRSQKLDQQKFRMLCPKHTPIAYTKPKWCRSQVQQLKGEKKN